MAKEQTAPFSHMLEKYRVNGNEIEISLGNVYYPNKLTDLTIDMLFINENDRKKGKGSVILDDIKRLGKEYGFKKLWVCANPAVSQGIGSSISIEELEKWYEKRGFSFYGKMIGTVMVCDLTD